MEDTTGQAEEAQEGAAPEELAPCERDMEEFSNPVQADKPTPPEYARHVVRQGDSLSAIAPDYGIFWETVWNDPNNSELKQKRRTEDVLMPGDVVFIPKRRPKEESCATDGAHTFRRKGIPIKLTMTIMGAEEPMANEPYRLEMDTGEILEGSLDGNGTLDVPIPPKARGAALYVGKGLEEVKHSIAIGHLDPVDSVSGIQGRLVNLGYDCGEANGRMNGATRGAIARYQKENGLKPTGLADGETRMKLEQSHGS